MSCTTNSKCKQYKREETYTYPNTPPKYFITLIIWQRRRSLSALATEAEPVVPSNGGRP